MLTELQCPLLAGETLLFSVILGWDSTVLQRTKQRTNPSCQERRTEHQAGLFPPLLRWAYDSEAVTSAMTSFTQRGDCRPRAGLWLRPFSMFYLIGDIVMVLLLFSTHLFHLPIFSVFLFLSFSFYSFLMFNLFFLFTPFCFSFCPSLALLFIVISFVLF